MAIPLNDFERTIRSVLSMASLRLAFRGKQAETIYALLYEMYPTLDYSVSLTANAMNVGTSQITTPIRVTLTCDSMPVNTMEELSAFLLAHGKSEQQAEETVRTLEFFLSLGV
jgi:hypothetical protein